MSFHLHTEESSKQVVRNKMWIVCVMQLVEV